MDNLSAHDTDEVNDWYEAHPRWTPGPLAAGTRAPGIRHWWRRRGERNDARERVRRKSVLVALTP